MTPRPDLSRKGLDKIMSKQGLALWHLQGARARPSLIVRSGDSAARRAINPPCPARRSRSPMMCLKDPASPVPRRCGLSCMAGRASSPKVCGAATNAFKFFTPTVTSLTSDFSDKTAAEQVGVSESCRCCWAPPNGMPVSCLPAELGARRHQQALISTSPFSKF